MKSFLGKETATCIGVAEYLSGEKKVLLLRPNAIATYWDKVSVIIKILERKTYD